MGGGASFFVTIFTGRGGGMAPLPPTDGSATDFLHLVYSFYFVFIHLKGHIHPIES